jgi:uncharacterized lipoprotein YmbA
LRPSFLRFSLALAAIAVLFAACNSLPVQRTYVLGDPAPPVSGVKSEAGLPIIELKTVSIPDYLDSTDILRRAGPNEVIPSPTGRWGERLSLGLTDALASALSRRLPKQVVTTMPTAEPTRRIFVDIERVDIDADGRCLLAARWQITEANGQSRSKSDHGTFSQTAASVDDPAVASAMTQAVDQLAEQIAKTIELE